MNVMSKCVYLLLLAFTFLGSSHAAAVAATALPSSVDFTKNEMPTGWEITAPEGSSVTTKDNFLIIECPADRHAGVRHRLDEDLVTVTAKIRDAISLYLVWNDDSFVGVGKVSPTPFARFQSAVGDNGKIEEVDHTGCQGPAAHLVRIQLGRDCIRFQYANGDGEPVWRTLRTIKRATDMQGAPKFVAVGKNLGITKDASMLVNTDSVGRGNRGLLARLDVAETPAGALEMNADERRWLTSPQLDPVAELLEESDQDPTFEEVARFYPEMKNKRDLVGVPGQRNDIGTDWLGRIDASPWEGPIAWFEIGEEGRPFAEKPEQISHRLLDGYIPIVDLKTKQHDADYQMTVFGWADEFSPTADLYTYVRLTAWAGGETTKFPNQIALTGKEQKKVDFKPEVTPSGLMTLCIRFKHPDPKSAEQVTAEEFESQRSKAETAWRDLLAKAAPFELPDSRVNEAYRAWIAYSLLNADRIDDRLHVHDGAGFYDLQFGYSVALHTMAFDLFRMPEHVADVLATQVFHQKSDGHYIQECGLPDQGGLVLSLATHYLVTKDAEWMKKNSEPLIKACDWILARRDEGPKEGMCKGLIKFRPYNDYNDPVFNYQGNIYCCQGLEAAALALGEIGETDAADRYAEEAAKYRQDIFNSMDAATIERRGVRMIPIEPDTHRLLKLTKYKGGEYYGLVASTMFENGFFPKDDPRGALYVNMLENEGGITAGVCEFQEGMDHAYANGYLMDRMLHGEVRKTLLGFWSMMAYGMTRDTYSPVEVTLYKTGDNHYTLPHTYSCTQQLRLLRNMLLHEEGDDLVIGKGVPRAWIEPSKRIEINDAPTMFGPMSCRIDTQDSRTATIELAPPTRTAPEEIRIHLRHPLARQVESVDVQEGKPTDVKFEGEVIRLAPSDPVKLLVKFAQE
jgi:hypothetical protein